MGGPIQRCSWWVFDRVVMKGLTYCHPDTATEGMTDIYDTPITPRWCWSMAQTGRTATDRRTKKQKSDSPPRGPFHQRLQSFVWRSGTRWLAGWIERRWMYLQLWDYCIYGCEHWDVMHMETNAQNFFCSVAVQYVEIEAIRVLVQEITSSKGLILILSCI